MYVQCELTKDNRVMVSSIPEKFAKKGSYVKLETNGVWEDGWKVEETYGKITEEEAIAARDRYKNHRKGTDI